VGRIIYINYRPKQGRLATIVDVVDQNKCLVEGPINITGVASQVMPYTRLSFTDLRLVILQNARAKTLKASWAKANILQTLQASS